jgi:23S rRNA (guanine2445-N2)-methyltransferase / 23S rRNA (guanine2069-N7)-methyltransferase
VDCYRLYDADLPEYAIALDLYQGDQLWAHVQEYEAPATIDPDKADARLRDALGVIPEVLGIPPEQVFLKVRQRQKGKAQYERKQAHGAFYPVRDGAARCWVNFTDYLDTGLLAEDRRT